MNRFRGSAFVVVSLAIAMLVGACGSTSESGGSGPGTGIQGHVTFGPTCPAERADSPCPNQPVRAVVTALKRVGEAVGSVRTDDRGAYFLRLDPGTYLVYARQLGDNAPLSKLERITVGTGQVIKLDLVIDSGIR
jgi:hypothetical protein